MSLSGSDRLSFEVESYSNFQECRSENIKWESLESILIVDVTAKSFDSL